jgi:RND superfamily putative drug exporter
VVFGVLLDTIVVRSMLVTVLNLDLGRWAWWPSRLARRQTRLPADTAGGGGPSPRAG